VKAEAKLIKDLSIEVTGNIKNKLEIKKMMKIIEFFPVEIFTINV
jgi:hypothetical protein